MGRAARRSLPPPRRRRRVGGNGLRSPHAAPRAPGPRNKRPRCRHVGNAAGTAATREVPPARSPLLPPAPTPPDGTPLRPATPPAASPRPAAPARTGEPGTEKGRGAGARAGPVTEEEGLRAQRAHALHVHGAVLHLLGLLALEELQRMRRCGRTRTKGSPAPAPSQI